MPIISPGLEIPANIFRGITPTFTGFSTTNPTDLANATDGDFTTATGAGKKTSAGAGTVGSFIFDLGYVATVLIWARMGLWITAGYVNAYLYASNDNISWFDYGSPTVEDVSDAAETILDTRAEVRTGRYFKYTFVSFAGADTYVKLYEVGAVRLL